MKYFIQNPLTRHLTLYYFFFFTTCVGALSEFGGLLLASTKGGNLLIQFRDQTSPGKLPRPRPQDSAPLVTRKK